MVAAAQLISEVTIKDSATAVADRIAAAMERTAAAEDKMTTGAATSTRALESSARQFERLKASVDPAYAAQQRFANQQQQIARAVELGIASEKEAAAITQQLQAQLVTGAAGAGRYGMAIQNAGFQVGDFAVQIASGQNPLRAFIQQGTQLISMFGPWGAVIGAAGAVVGALATSFFNLQDPTKKAQEAQDAYNKTLEHAKEVMKGLRGEAELTAQALAADARNTLAIAELQYKQASDALSKIPQVFHSGPGGRIGAIDIANPEFAAAKAALDEQYRQLLILRSQLGIYDDRFSGLNRKGDAYKGPANILPPDFDLSVQKLLDANEALFGKTVKTGAAGKATEIKTTTDAIKEQASAVDDLTQSLQNQLALMQESDRQRSIDEVLIRAQQAAERDYDAGLRDSPLLDPATINRIKTTEGAIFDLNDAQKKTVTSTHEIARAQTDAAKATDGWKNQMTELGSTFTSAFENAVISGQKWSSVLQGLYQDLGRIALRIAESQALTALFGEGGVGSGGGLFGSLWNALFGSSGGTTVGGGAIPIPTTPTAHLAAGGPAAAGNLYRVNENGMEYFRPNVSGVVIPMGAGAGNSGTVVQVIDQRGANAPAVQQTRSTGPDGRQLIRIFIKEAAQDVANGGMLGQAINRRIGASPVAQVARG